MTSTNDIVTKRSNGLSAVVVPIMVPLSKRVEDQSVQIVFEMLMNFSIFNALNDLRQQKFPKVLIVLNSLRRKRV